MPVKTCYPNIVSQNTGDAFRKFKDLNNVKSSSDNTYAVSNGLIHGKNGTNPRQPSTVTVKGFNVNLPVGAEITRIHVDFRHQKTKYQDEVCNLPAPKVSLVGTVTGSVTGNAPSTTAKTVSKTFNISPNIVDVNNSNFGVEINYKKNTNNKEGYIRLYWVRIRVEYELSEYNLSIQGKQLPENDEADYILKVNINNLKHTRYTPTVTITVPPGFNYVNVGPIAGLIQINARTFQYTPPIDEKWFESHVDLNFKTDITYTEHRFTGECEAVEGLNGASARFNIVLEEPTPVSEETAPDLDKEITDDKTIEQITYVEIKVGEELNLTLNNDLQEYIKEMDGAINGEWYLYFKMFDESENDITEYFTVNGVNANTYHWNAGDVTVAFVVSPIEYVANRVKLIPYVYKRYLPL